MLFCAQKKNILLTLVVRDNHLFCIFSQKYYNKSYNVLYCSNFLSQNYELHDGIMYNYTSIRTFLDVCIRDQKIYPEYLNIIIDNKQATQEFVVASQPINSVSSGGVSLQLASHIHYIGPCNEIDHLLCKCSVSDYGLLQYQFLVMPFNIQLLNISCSMLSLLYAYRGYKKDVFRSSELVQDIIKHDSDIINFFTDDMLYRLMPSISASDVYYKKSLLLAYGHMIYQELLYG